MPGNPASPGPVPQSPARAETTSRRAMLRGDGAAALALAAGGAPAVAHGATGAVAPPVTHYRTNVVDGVTIFYREANWVHDQALLDRPGNAQIQMDLFYDYRTNLPLYPAFQAYFRDRKPPTLIVWGRNDKIFPAEGATPYLRDLPDADLHLLDTGHFALEDELDVMAPLILGFLDQATART